MGTPQSSKVNQTHAQLNSGVAFQLLVDYPCKWTLTPSTGNAKCGNCKFLIGKVKQCQKYLFNKIKDSDIVDRMRKISEEDNLDVDCDALYLIALNVEGSLRDAETMLDQLSLLGKIITTDVVNEVLMELLELTMSSNTADTVKIARELMDLGIDPVVLMSQMAKLIMDIIAGTYQVVEARYGKLSIQLCNLRFSYLAPN
ncbi:AAA-type ATPase family protein [Artemisia annua]|uniref:AAA-type ATPase family protein n=1 Tax=Artemisia annua TaxID=35608 RepID=A0A2U1PZB8_ARTAN|nr:AAA-type ATPase family protein [Artemisia annua]